MYILTHFRSPMFNHICSAICAQPYLSTHFCSPISIPLSAQPSSKESRSLQSVPGRSPRSTMLRHNRQVCVARHHANRTGTGSRLAFEDGHIGMNRFLWRQYSTRHSKKYVENSRFGSLLNSKCHPLVDAKGIEIFWKYCRHSLGRDFDPTGLYSETLPFFCQYWAAVTRWECNKYPFLLKASHLSPLSSPAPPKPQGTLAARPPGPLLPAEEDPNLECVSRVGWEDFSELWLILLIILTAFILCGGGWLGWSNICPIFFFSQYNTYWYFH